MKPNTNNDLTELVFILDRSGSMAGLEKDTIGGFNSLIQRQKGKPGRALVSTVLFDDRSQVLHDRVPLEQVPLMTAQDYWVRGCTALLDAMGDAMHHIGNIHKYARPEDVPAHTLFVITTDGMENASRRHALTFIQQEVGRRQQQDGWEFLFLGANIDAIGTAGRLGIRPECAANYCNDTVGTRLNYDAMDRAVSAVRASMPLGGWKRDVEADFKLRGRKK